MCGARGRAPAPSASSSSSLNLLQSTLTLCGGFPAALSSFPQYGPGDAFWTTRQMLRGVTATLHSCAGATAAGASAPTRARA